VAYIICCDIYLHKYGNITLLSLQLIKLSADRSKFNNFGCKLSDRQFGRHASKEFKEDIKAIFIIKFHISKDSKCKR
jgi:hypothetical protein